MMDQLLGIANDVVRGNIGRDMRRLRILGPTEPDRLFIQMNQYYLGGIERPAIKTGQPAHIRWVLTDNQIEARICHSFLGFCQPTVVFRLAKWRRINGVVLGHNLSWGSTGLLRAYVLITLQGDNSEIVTWLCQTRVVPSNQNTVDLRVILDRRSPRALHVMYHSDQITLLNLVP